MLDMLHPIKSWRAEQEEERRADNVCDGTGYLDKWGYLLIVGLFSDVCGA